MAKMLGREMDPVERAQLLNMTLHPGYKTLRHMMDQLCELYTADVIKLDPVNTDRYNEKLEKLAMMARIANDVCTSLIKSIETHDTQAGIERAQEEQIKEVLRKVESQRTQQDQSIDVQ